MTKATLDGDEVNYEVHRGAAFVSDVVYTDENDAIIDVTGYTALMHIRETVGSDTILATLTSADSSITVTGAAGKFDLLLTAAQTKAITQNKAKYDLLITPPSGNSVTLIEGEITFKDSVTRT